MGRDDEKGRLELVFEEGYELGWSEGYDAAVYFLISNEACYLREKSKLYKDRIA